MDIPRIDSKSKRCLILRCSATFKETSCFLQPTWSLGLAWSGRPNCGSVEGVVLSCADHWLHYAHPPVLSSRPLRVRPQMGLTRSHTLVCCRTPQSRVMQHQTPWEPHLRHPGTTYLSDSFLDRGASHSNLWHGIARTRKELDGRERYEGSVISLQE